MIIDYSLYVGVDDEVKILFKWGKSKAIFGFPDLYIE